MTTKAAIATAILKSIDKPPRTKRYGRKWGAKKVTTPTGTTRK